MYSHTLAIVAMLTLQSAVFAGEPSLGPVIDAYGPTFPVTERDVPLDTEITYRAVFDVAGYASDMSTLNGRLVSVARFLNMHARNDVPVANMDLAVVVHGAALRNLLHDTAYRARFGMPNPNLDLVTRLHEAGVRFYVCGQSMAFGDIAKDELSDIAEVALSAMTMLTVLQQRGYALLP